LDIGNRIRKISKAYSSITEGAAWVGYVTTIAMVVIVLIDVTGRYFFNTPLRGSFELVEQFMVLSGGFMLMYCTVKRGHVIIDIITSRFPKRIQEIIHCIVSFIGFGTSIIIAYNIFLYALRQLMPYPQTTDTLKLITAPFQFSLVLAMLLCGIAFLLQTFDFLIKESDTEKGEGNIV
jgi:TRAP-type C4-dicarboxylate transport system permease small subunit